MATYRTVYLSFWTDPKVDDDFTPEDKYFYIYLLTNPHTNLCGCYEISMKQMVRETGYNEDTVKRLLARMETVHDVIRYDSLTKEVLVMNWHKYNWSKSKDVLSGVEKTASEIKSDKFRSYLFDVLSGTYGHPVYRVYRGSTDPRGTSVTDTVSDSVTDTDSDKYEPTIYQTEFSTLKILPDGSYERKDVRSDFDIFLSQYPSPVDPDKARAVWNKLNPDDELVIDIMDGLKAWKESAQWEDPQYIPYPANWLTARRWEQKPPKRKPKAVAVASGKTFPGQNYEQKSIPRFEDLPNLIPTDL